MSLSRFVWNGKFWTHPDIMPNGEYLVYKHDTVCIGRFIDYSGDGSSRFIFQPNGTSGGVYFYLPRDSVIKPTDEIFGWKHIQEINVN